MYRLDPPIVFGPVQPTHEIFSLPLVIRSRTSTIVAHSTAEFAVGEQRCHPIFKISQLCDKILGLFDDRIYFGESRATRHTANFHFM